MHAQCESSTLLRTSLRRHDFMAHALNLIVAGIVIKCSIVLQIGICVREKVMFWTNQDLPLKLRSTILQFLSKQLLNISKCCVHAGAALPWLPYE